MTSAPANERTELEPDVLTDYGAVSAAPRGDAVDRAGAEAEKVPLNPLGAGDGSSLATALSGDAAVAVETASQPANGRPAAAGVSPAPKKSRNPSALGRINAWLMKVGPNWFSNPDIQRHKKLILIAASFCVFGLALCLVGIALTSNPPHALYNLVFIVGGFIIFVPGIYHLVYVILAYRGVEGYDFQNLPLMD